MSVLNPLQHTDCLWGGRTRSHHNRQQTKAKNCVGHSDIFKTGFTHNAHSIVNMICCMLFIACSAFQAAFYYFYVLTLYYVFTVYIYTPRLILCRYLQTHSHRKCMLVYFQILQQWQISQQSMWRCSAGTLQRLRRMTPQLFSFDRFLFGANCQNNM